MSEPRTPPDIIRPEWRTDTVVQLCRAMREQGDYGAAPILADALQDADCTYTFLLAQLRGRPDPFEMERLVALIEGGAPAEAVVWIEAHAEQLGDSWGYGGDESDGPPDQPMNYRELMGTAHRYVDTGDMTTQHGAQNWQDDFSPAEFWPRFHLVTGKAAPVQDGPYDSTTPFSCSC